MQLIKTKDWRHKTKTQPYTTQGERRRGERKETINMLHMLQQQKLFCLKHTLICWLSNRGSCLADTQKETRCQLSTPYQKPPYLFQVYYMFYHHRGMELKTKATGNMKTHILETEQKSPYRQRRSRTLSWKKIDKCTYTHTNQT